ncbi:MAG: AbrB/MazE/SpoVT family DNA-binding domain-containing protein [Sulfobacillus sp.]
MLKPTGDIRRVDRLGRMVLPKELRDRLGIADGDAVQIWVDGDQVMLAKHIETCVFCGGQENLAAFKGKRVCRPCQVEAARRHPPPG